MKKVIISKDGTVINIIEIKENTNYSIESGFLLVDYEPRAEIGGTFINGIFTPPSGVPNLVGIRRQELKDKFEQGTASLGEVQEFLSDHI